ncbi:MAG: hypothetical protein ACRD3D_03895 [Terriglobia bacterium]
MKIKSPGEKSRLRRTFRERLPWLLYGTAIAALCASLASAAQPRGAQSAAQRSRTYRVASVAVALAAPAPGDSPPAAANATGFAGKRDPFRLPPPPSSKDGLGVRALPANLPPGPAGLIIADLKLEGVLSEGHSMIAVVTTSTSNRAYFLTANEQLYDGSVAEITAGAIYFAERLRGPKGQVSVRQAVKRLRPKAGEGR